MDKEIIKKRVRAIRKRMKKEGINCLILSKPVNVTYVTGFCGEDSWAVIGPRGVYLLTDSRYTEQAQSECPSCSIIERTGSLAEAAAKLVKKIKSVKRTAVEKSISLAEYESLRRKIKGRIKTVGNIIEEVRSIKETAEITAIRSAAGIAAKALGKARRYVKAGVMENELAGRLDFEIRKLGARNSFETIVAFGANASRPHHKPGNRKLKKNDSILIDFGVRYKNYCCDLTRCFAVGKVSGLYKKVYGAVKEAQAAAIRMIRAGVEIKKVDAAARDVIGKYDLPIYGHGTGHGLGLEVHELPVVSKKIKGKLEAGQVITIEPGVYIPGKLGVRIEDDVLVTETGCKILSGD